MLKGCAIVVELAEYSGRKVRKSLHKCKKLHQGQHFLCLNESEVHITVKKKKATTGILRNIDLS